MSRKETGFYLRVNPILCDGFGHCHELAPELVNIDEWGYPVIKIEITPLNDRNALHSARYAARGCPRQALRIERASEKS